MSVILRAMSIIDIIAAKRDGQKHTQAQLEFVARAAAGQHEVADYQLSAWLMAAFINGLDDDETLWLTLAMAASGDRVDLSRVPKPWLDKHSTGGVGDKTTLVLLPLLSACGITMVKMSGRGLGITGGTIDKLESIPGFRVDLSPDELIDQAARIGIALTGQSPKLAPADKTLYALRDTTATVNSMPLIVASILSKKIAGGADHLVLDVKAGSGAFMTSIEMAEDLARSLIKVATAAGIKTSAAITDMSRPLGRAVGNAIEVREAIEVLEGAGGRFPDLCCSLAAGALFNAGSVTSLDEGKEVARKALASGAAFDKWSDWVHAQTGGKLKGSEVSAHLESAPVITDVRWSDTDTFVDTIDARLIGEAVLNLGGGRKRKEDTVDHRVGIEIMISPGDALTDRALVARVHARTDEDAQAAIQAVRSAIVTAMSPGKDTDALQHWVV